MPEKSSGKDGQRVFSGCAPRPPPLYAMCDLLLTGVVWVPLVPRVVGDAAALDVPVDAGLQDGRVASITIDTDPLNIIISQKEHPNDDTVAHSQRNQQTRSCCSSSS